MAHFSVNKIINTIVATLEAYDSGDSVYPFKDKCHNHFGEEPGDWDKILTQNEHIYIFYVGDDTEPLTGNMMTGDLHLEFWVIDLVTAVASDKANFQADKLRAYLMSGAWRTLGIDTDYPAMNIQPYFNTETRQALLLDDKGKPTGYIWTVFKGHIGFDSSMSS